ncbi:hypothetical protein COCVIDRAFT_86892 [Bipolaris victoriae FI3]|uniref:Uncharacterized protein n=1 Tax=Bipolaris victoriae (strain FI3) TaxID=930091 RepID=W7EUI4_BIPV3|nr:hypothetical protein COCVIDRAFT_86892 [Bipolaris victoriae FI3]
MPTTYEQHCVLNQNTFVGKLVLQSRSETVGTLNYGPLKHFYLITLYTIMGNLEPKPLGPVAAQQMVIHM